MSASEKNGSAQGSLRAREMFSARLAGAVMPVARSAGAPRGTAVSAVAAPVPKAMASRAMTGATAWPSSKDGFAPKAAPRSVSVVSSSAADRMVPRGPQSILGASRTAAKRAVSVAPARAPSPAPRAPSPVPRAPSSASSVSSTDDAPAPRPHAAPVHPGHVELIDGATRRRISLDPVHKVPEAHRFAPTPAGHRPVVRIVITTKNGQRKLDEYGVDGRLLRTSTQPVA